MVLLALALCADLLWIAVALADSCYSVQYAQWSMQDLWPGFGTCHLCIFQLFNLLNFRMVKSQFLCFASVVSHVFFPLHELHRQISPRNVVHIMSHPGQYRPFGGQGGLVFGSDLSVMEAPFTSPLDPLGCGKNPHRNYLIGGLTNIFYMVSKGNHPQMALIQVSEIL